jgi:hypothetical protein
MGNCNVCGRQREDRELMDGKIVFEGNTLYGVCADCQIGWRQYLLQQIKELIDYAKKDLEPEKRKRGRPRKEVNS